MSDLSLLIRNPTVSGQSLWPDKSDVSGLPSSFTHPGAGAHGNSISDSSANPNPITYAHAISDSNSYAVADTHTYADGQCRSTI